MPRATRGQTRRLPTAGIAALLHLAAAGSLLASEVHATFYEMDVRCLPVESRIEGRARIGLRESGQASKTLRFWLHGELRVATVRAGGEALEVSQAPQRYDLDYSLIGNRVEVLLPGGVVPETIEVEWSGFMHPSRARSPSDYMRIDETGVFLRALGYSPWFPVLLEEGEDEHQVDFPRVSIEVPKPMQAVFSGDFVSAEDAGGRARYLWRAAGLPLHAAQLTARPFVVSTAGEVRVYSLDDEASLAAAEKILGLARELLRYYAEHYSAGAVSGQLHVVEMPKYGDISSGSVVGIQEDSWRSFDESMWAKRTLAHELVHPFVQPEISSRDPLYALVIEGFPSYYHYAALEAQQVVDYAERISTIRETYLQKRQTGRHPRGWPLPTEKPISEIAADQIGTYKDLFILSDRAILFLDELRRRMGEEGFAAFNRQLFARKTLDDGAYRALVLHHLPGFEEELTIWLDTTALPRRLAE